MSSKMNVNDEQMMNGLGAINEQEASLAQIIAKVQRENTALQEEIDEMLVKREKKLEWYEGYEEMLAEEYRRMQTRCQLFNDRAEKERSNGIELYDAVENVKLQLDKLIVQREMEKKRADELRALMHEQQEEIAELERQLLEELQEE